MIETHTWRCLWNLSRSQVGRSLPEFEWKIYMTLKRSIKSFSTSNQFLVECLMFLARLNFFKFYFSLRDEDEIKCGSLPIRGDTEWRFFPQGVLFLKHIQSPWSICMSRRTLQKYYYNSVTNDSNFDRTQLTFSNPR